MLVLLVFAFISGLVTILAPCIWPLLPVVLSSSSLAGKWRPAGITLGVMASFGVLTLLLSGLVSSLHINANLFRYASVLVIIFLGLTLLVPWLNRMIEAAVSRLASRFNQSGRPSTGFGGGLVMGLSLGVVWTPCAGPILAAIATLSATGHVSWQLGWVTLAYVLGTGIPLLGLAYGGQTLIQRSRRLSAHTGQIQRAFGAIMIITALLIGFGYDQVLEARLLSFFPQFSFELNQFESQPHITQALDALKGGTSSAAVDDSQLFNAGGLGITMPSFGGATHWLNTNQPLTPQSLKGKVVLVDFWTYTCINCLRTLPYVTRWYDTYQGQGFVVIGVHTPEFAFEHDTSNVARAIQQFGIHYPVAQDNNYTVWNAYSNQYWPAEYLFDAKGKLQRTEFGEGNYDKMELAIQTLLKDAGQKVTEAPPTATAQLPDEEISPETYLGTNRLEFSYPAAYGDGPGEFTLPPSVPLNNFGLGGNWDVQDEYVSSGQGATLRYHFQAGQMYLVMRPPASGSGTIQILLDGKPIPNTLAGADVHDGMLTVDQDRLYALVNLHGKVEAHTLELRFNTTGTQAYAFTFGM